MQEQAIELKEEGTNQMMEGDAEIDNRQPKKKKGRRIDRERKNERKKKEKEK